MACSSYLTAFQAVSPNDQGTRPIFFDLNKLEGKAYIVKKIPCGQCIRCKLDRAAAWSVRCVHESKLYDSNCFVTLTYDDDNMPEDWSLRHEDFREFMRTLRSYYDRSQFDIGRDHRRKVKFFMCGEYGDRFGWPHYHSLLFNYDFKDKKYFRTTDTGHKVFTSDILSEFWGKGICEIGNVSYDSAGYIARYCTKKVTGDMAYEHYRFVDPLGNVWNRLPEYGSNSNGIGLEFLRKFKGDVYPRDFVLKGQAKLRVPRYYDKQFEVLYPDEFKEIKKKRLSNMKKRDEGFRQYCIREEVTYAQLNLRKA